MALSLPNSAPVLISNVQPAREISRVDQVGMSAECSFSEGHDRGRSLAILFQLHDCTSSLRRKRGNESAPKPLLVRWAAEQVDVTVSERLIGVGKALMFG
jgi:hypothetical protein